MLWPAGGPVKVHWGRLAGSAAEREPGACFIVNVQKVRDFLNAHASETRELHMPVFKKSSTF
jgi:hypothetical protein